MRLEARRSILAAPWMDQLWSSANAELDAAPVTLLEHAGAVQAVAADVHGGDVVYCGLTDVSTLILAECCQASGGLRAEVVCGCPRAPRVRVHTGNRPSDISANRRNPRGPPRSRQPGDCTGGSPGQLRCRGHRGRQRRHCRCCARTRPNLAGTRTLACPGDRRLTPPRAGS